ncbi:MAG: hypothetical protein GF401_15755 [Chitinivibrionales bacterium]|nr:hypothetical protein [Chitinivibrionales bacterium]
MKVATGVYNAILYLTINYIDAFGEEKTGRLVEGKALGVQRGPVPEGLGW